MQPFLLNAGHVVEFHGERLALHLDDLGGDEQAGRLDVRVFVEMAGVTAREPVNATTGARLDAEVIAEGGEQRLGQRLRIGDLVVDGQTGAFGELEELFLTAGGLTRRHRMHAVTGAGIRLEVHRLGSCEGTQQRLELAHVILLPKLLALVGRILLSDEQNVTPLRHRGAQRGLSQAAELRCCQEHARETRVQRELGHLPADVRDLAVGVRGAEVVEEVFGTFESGGRRRFEPFDVRLTCRSGRTRLTHTQRQQRLAQIEPLHFRQLALGTQQVLALGPKAHCDSGAESASASSALFGGGAADFLHGERVDAAPRVVVRDARRAAVDDGLHSLDGQGGFGDVGADDDLRLLTGRDGGVLILRREFTMQRHHAAAACKGAALDRGDGLADLVAAGHEDEHVAAEAGRVRQIFTGAGGLIPDRLGIPGFELKRRLVTHLHGEGAAFGFEQLAGLHEVHQRSWHEGGGHDDDLQIRPPLLQSPRKGQHEVAVEMTLVEFVDHDAADAVEHRVFEQHAQHDAFGDIGQSRLAAGDVFKAHLITDFAAETCVSFTRHALRQHAGGNPARLQHHTAFAFGEDA